MKQEDDKLKKGDKVKGIYNGFLKYSGKIQYCYNDGTFIVKMASGRQLTITPNEDTIEKEK